MTVFINMRTTIIGYINPIPSTFNSWTTEQQDRWNYYHYRMFTRRNWLDERQIKKLAKNAGIVNKIEIIYEGENYDKEACDKDKTYVDKITLIL